MIGGFYLCGETLGEHLRCQIKSKLFLQLDLFLGIPKLISLIYYFISFLGFETLCHMVELSP